MLSVVLLGLVALGGFVSANPESRIVNGQEATYGDHPYICSIQLRQGFSFYHICGCVIYNTNTVVTAAHCLDGATASSLRIQAGNHVLTRVDDYEQTSNVRSYTMHPNYNGNQGGFPNDIAMMRLTSDLEFNSHVASPTFDEDPNSDWEGQQCWLSGWGRLSGSGSTADTLKKVAMTKISNAACSSAWAPVQGANINSGHICFYEPTKSACSGDSGGPVRCGNTLTGVTSWGVSTCSGEFPSVYTRLSVYASWMRNTANSM